MALVLYKMSRWTDCSPVTSVNVSSGFRCSLLFLALLLTSQTLAKPVPNSDNDTPVSSAAIERIETTLHEIKKQIAEVKDDIKIIIKEDKTLVKGKDNF